MQKKLSNKRLGIFGLLIFLVLPFALVYLGRMMGVEWIAKIISLFLLFLLFLLLPLLFIISAVTPSCEKYFSLPIKSKYNSLPLRIFMALMGLMGIIYISLPLTRDVIGIFKDPIPSKNTVVEKTFTSAYDLIVRSQKVHFEGEEKMYQIVYGTKWLRKGDEVNIKYLPKTRYILEVDSRE